MAPRLRSAVVRFDALPEEALRVIMLALPVDARARAACVCRGWRAILADPSLWQVLDLTPAGGVAAERVTDNLSRSVAVRAAGQRACPPLWLSRPGCELTSVRSLARHARIALTRIVASAVRSLSLFRTPNAHAGQLLVALVVTCGAELQQVNTNATLGAGELRAVFARAPRLQVLNAHAIAHCDGLLPFLRNDPPYGPLRVSELEANLSTVDEADVLAFAAAVATHEPLQGLKIVGVRSVRGLTALVDAAAERRFSRLSLQTCDLDVVCMPALARLLQRGSLTMLHVDVFSFPHTQEESVPELCAGLRACRSLTHLRLALNTHGDANRRTVTDLLDAAAALPVLSSLDLSWSRFQDRAAAGRALGALLAANLPNLRTLIVYSCHLGDEGMAALLDGLAVNTHLRELDFCQQGNDLSEAFQRNQLGPALAELAARRELDDA
jgi:hypothetical protein